MKKNYDAIREYALDVSRGQSRNLLLMGGTGLGKTHLMNAIAGHIITTQPEKSVCYVSSETFTNQLIDALRNSNNNNQAETSQIF